MFPSVVSRSCLRNQQVIHFSSISWTLYRDLFKIHFFFFFKKGLPGNRYLTLLPPPFLIPSTSHRTSWKVCLCLSTRFLLPFPVHSSTGPPPSKSHSSCDTKSALTKNKSFPELKAANPLRTTLNH